MPFRPVAPSSSLFSPGAKHLTILRAARLACLALCTTLATAPLPAQTSPAQKASPAPATPPPAQGTPAPPARPASRHANETPRWEAMNYGPFLSASISAPVPGNNIANKGIAIRLGANRQGAVLFDTDLMRFAAGWTGDFLHLTGVAFDGKHGPNPRVAGEVFFATAVGPGWSADARGELADPRPVPYGPLPAGTTRYKGLYLHGDHVVLSYTVGGAEVLDLPALVETEGETVFTRTLQISPLNEARTIVVCDITPTTVPTVEANASLAILTLPAVAETKTVVGLVGAPAGAKVEILDGKRVVVRLPAVPQGATFTIALWKGAPASQTKFEAYLASPAAKPAVDFKALTAGGPARWTQPITTKGVRGTGTGAYVVDTITAPYENPYNAWLRFGGFDFFADGTRAAITTWSGDVWLVSGIDDQLGTLTWKRFATGLFQPLGLRIVNDEVYVLGRDQLTRLKDLNGDGEADVYEAFNHDVMVTPSFHEFALDLQTDREGNFYFAKGGAVRPGGRGWQVITPHTGSVLRVSKDGSKLDVFATGVRAPNGMGGAGPNGELTLADNEGTWTPTCRLNIVREGDFLGVTDLSHRNPLPTAYGNPICWIPHSVDNSSGGQAWVPDDRWGLPKGQLLHTSYGKSSLFVTAYETLADGTVQGGVTRLPLDFDAGIMRARFNARDGQLYLCGLKGWQTTSRRDGAFHRVRYTGAPVDVPVTLNVKAKGVEIGFLTPVDKASAADVQNWSVEQWNYLWTAAYGSPEVSVANPAEKAHDPVDVKSVQVSEDGKRVFLEIDDLQPVMQMKIKFLIDGAAGQPLDYEIYNTIARVPNS